MLKKLLCKVVLFFLPYFGLDMVTPEIPGAFSFNWDQAIEVVEEDRALVVLPAVVESRPRPGSEALLQATQTAPLSGVDSAPRPGWRIPLRNARSALSRDPAAADEAA